MRTSAHRRAVVLFFSLFALSTASVAFADGVLPAVATPVQREQAQSRFLRGKELMSKNRYDEALAEFRASHDIVASPNTRLELARCLRAMGKTVAAYAELGRSMVEAKELVGQDNRYQRAYDASVAERAEIEPQLGFVSMTIVNASDDSSVRVNGEELRRAAWGEPAPVVAGPTEIVVQSPGRQPVTRKLTIAAGQKAQVTIDARSSETPVAPPAVAAETPAPSDGGKSLRTGAFVAGGVGAVGLITAVVAGAMAQSTYGDLGTACHNGPCPPEKAGEISSGKSQETIANVALVVGVLGLGTGAVLYYFAGKSAGPSGSGAALVVGPSSVALRGTW
jgi:hypothetical protein